MLQPDVFEHVTGEGIVAYLCLCLATAASLWVRSQVLNTLRQRVLTVNELLRHMWACFPLASQQRQTKAQRLSAALSSQHEGWVPVTA